MNMKDIAQKAALGLYALVLVFVGIVLFGGDQILFFANSFTGTPEQHPSAETLTVAYAFPVQSLEPTLFDPVTRSRLVNVYEGLVRTDRNLKIEPAIAVSWGLVDLTTWEFTLRPGVKFHDGAEVRTSDVVDSIERARTHEGSQLKNLLNSISEVKSVDEKTLRITTRVPDPLLLNKLAVTYVFPKDQTDFEKPVGTGPYQFVSLDDGSLSLKRFEDYWGEKPYYGQVVLRSITGRDERTNALKNGSVDLLADVPPSAASGLVSQDIVLKTIPSLEVNFLMMNPNEGLFINKGLREAAAYALDRQQFVEIAGGYAQPVRQFVSSGVFGFNPEIEGYAFDMKKALATAEPVTSQSFEQLLVMLDYAVGNDVIAQYIQDQFRQIGIDVLLNPLPGQEFQEKLESGSSELYYLGWRSELGDANDFLQNVVHSRDQSGLSGQYNGTGYLNPEVDELIDSSLHDLNVKTRLKSMQEAMKILVEDDIAGIPLFETQTIFAYKNKLQFEPRVDGYVYAAEIR